MNNYIANKQGLDNIVFVLLCIVWTQCLNYYDRQIFHSLHWTNQWLCVSRRTNINDLKPDTNYQSTTLCTIRQYLIDLAGLVWNSNLLQIISGLASQDNFMSTVPHAASILVGTCWMRPRQQGQFLNWVFLLFFEII